MPIVNEQIRKGFLSKHFQYFLYLDLRDNGLQNGCPVISLMRFVCNLLTRCWITVETIVSTD
jgi:hypothetical protein